MGLFLGHLNIVGLRLIYSVDLATCPMPIKLWNPVKNKLGFNSLADSVTLDINLVPSAS